MKLAVRVKGRAYRGQGVRLQGPGGLTGRFDLEGIYNEVILMI